MTLNEIVEIETIVRQGWCEENSPFKTWLNVDQDQAIELIQRIPNRLPVRPQPLPTKQEKETT